MNQKPYYCHQKLFEHYEVALKSLDKATEIAVKLGMYPTEVERLREQELKELQQFFLNRCD